VDSQAASASSGGASSWLALSYLRGSFGLGTPPGGRAMVHPGADVELGRRREISSIGIPLSDSSETKEWRSSRGASHDGALGESRSPPPELAHDRGGTRGNRHSLDGGTHTRLPTMGRRRGCSQNLAEHQRQLEAEKAAGGALVACQQKRR
jgi:hypothetical protein